MNKARDFVSLAIADFEALSEKEKGPLVLEIMDDQPILMGYLTNLADDFTDEEHEALVDSTIILINAFISAGIAVNMIPHQIVEEVIDEKLEQYAAAAEQEDLELKDLDQLSDSPKVFQDLKTRAIFNAKLAEESLEKQFNYSLILDTIVSMVERNAAQSLEGKSNED